MTSPRPPNRLPAETSTIPLTGGRSVDMSVARLPDGRAIEIVLAGCGVIGQELGIIVHEIGVAISRALQDRDPVTGEGRSP